MVLTLGSPPEKGGEKKTLVLTLGSPPEKGGEKKTLVLTLGRPPDFDFRTWSCPSVDVLKPRSALGRTDRRTPCCINILD